MKLLHRDGEVYKHAMRALGNLSNDDSNECSMKLIEKHTVSQLYRLITLQ